MKYPRFAVIGTASLAIVAIVLFSASFKSQPGIFISEVCPHNDEIIHDSVGFYNDYIVISNTSDEPVSLKGYALSDNKAIPDRFIFDDIRIAPQGALIVWAGEKQEFNGLFADDASIYTGFRLSDNESLFLTDPEGVVADSVRIPVMKNNSVLIRGGAGEKGTVGSSNFRTAEKPDISAGIAPPVFSAISGYYQDPFFLAIDGGKNSVYYTVDGSDPYTSGTRYSEPVPIIDRSDMPDRYASLGPVSAVYDQYYPIEPVSKAMVIRAVSQRSDGTFSKESVATYFVGEKIRKICEGTYTVSMVSDPDDLFSGDRGIYVTGNTWDSVKDNIDPTLLHKAPANYNMRGDGWDREASVTLFGPDGSLLYDERAGISIHGCYSRALNPKGFNLKPLAEGQKVFDGLLEDAGGSLVLRTGAETDTFKTGFRNSLNSRICKNLRVAPQHSVCCQLYLNGEYWGCYNLIDRLDESFIEARYGVPAQNVDLLKICSCPKGLRGSEETLLRYQELVDYVSGHDFSDERYYQQFCDMMDIDNLIDYYCAEIYFANDDAYINNVGLWVARTPGDNPFEDGKWRFALYDLDNTDGYESSSYADVDSFVEGNWDNCNPDVDLFFSNLSKNDEFRRRFRDRFAQLIRTDFSYDTVEPILDEMEKEYTHPMLMTFHRFYDPAYEEEWYHESVDVIRDFFRDRGRYMSEYLMKHMGE